MITLKDIERYRADGYVPSLSEIEQWLDFNKELKFTVDEMHRRALGRKKIRCAGCNRMNEIGKLTYIQTHYHVPPRGCNEGDYWKQSEGQYNCPKCNTRNRLYDQQHIQELKHAFGDLVNTY